MRQAASGVPPDRVCRRAFVGRAAGLVLGAPSLSSLLTGCGGEDNGAGMMSGDGPPEWMMSGGIDSQMMRDMPVIRDLLVNHEQIERRVEDVPGGIRAVATSSNKRISDLIRTHVIAMKERVEEGNPIRQMDPLFREIFDHYRKIRMDVEAIPGGVRVTETSEDPQVALLIRQHARRAVSEFVRFGRERAMQPTPLPDRYRA